MSRCSNSFFTWSGQDVSKTMENHLFMHEMIRTDGTVRIRTAARIPQTLQELEITNAEKGIIIYRQTDMNRMKRLTQCLKTMIETLEEKENWTRSKKAWERVEGAQARNLLTFVQKLYEITQENTYEQFYFTQEEVVDLQRLVDYEEFKCYWTTSEFNEFDRKIRVVYRNRRKIFRI